MPILQQPEAYIWHVAKLLDAEGIVANEQTLAFLRTLLSALKDWVILTAPT